MANRTGKGQFKAGQTGNPHGRPKEYPELKALAREYTPEAIEKLASIMRDGDTSAAQAMAADKLLDRGWGKPTQPHAGEEGAIPILHEVIVRIVDPKG